MVLIEVKTKEREEKLRAEGKLFYCIIGYENDPLDGESIKTVFAYYTDEKEMYKAFEKIRNKSNFSTGCYEQLKL